MKQIALFGQQKTKDLQNPFLLKCYNRYMNKKTLIALIAIIIIIVIVLLVSGGKQSVAPDYKNLSYTVDGKPILLTNGRGLGAEVYFGNEARADLNGDGKEDTAFIFFQQTGGSGTFYYLAVALSSGDIYRGTNAILLGDRIAPQTTEIKNGEIIVNYADRKAGQPFSTQPSVGVSKHIKVENNTLVEIK